MVNDICKGLMPPEIPGLIQHPYRQQSQQIPTAKSRGIRVVSSSYK